MDTNVETRGTCQSCGRFLRAYSYVEYPEDGVLAHRHKAWQERDGKRIWEVCPGSNQPVKA